MDSKHRVTISVDEDTLVKIREIIRSGNFRNRSHVFEQAVKQMLEVQE